ncbi:hypothetical protein J3R82DRAFT_1189 [Butyriboletus roseoflavus]|nr:hypothetical protein J3R82DRAFT_1189 [Butyriboletus roseoflavus]
MVFNAAGSSGTAICVKGAVYVTTGPLADKKGLLGMVGRWTGAVLGASFLGGVSTPWRFIHVVNTMEDTKM